MKKRIIIAMLLIAAALLASGCDGGVPEFVDQYQPLGEAFLEQLYAQNFDATHAAFSEEMKINITRKRLEEEVFPRLYDHGGDIRGLRFVSAYGTPSGMKLWLHMKQKNAVIVYCLVFDAEMRIAEFTFR